jgi:hypothetical protein
VDHPVFTYLDFIIVFFFYEARSLALRPTPNLEDQVSVFMSSRHRVAQLYPQAPGSLFVAFYDSQGYGGDIRPRLHKGHYFTHLSVYVVYFRAMSVAQIAEFRIIG